MNRNSALGQRAQLLPLQLWFPRTLPSWLLISFSSPSPSAAPAKSGRLCSPSTAQHPGQVTVLTDRRPRGLATAPSPTCVPGRALSHRGQLAFPSLPRRNGPTADHLPAHLEHLEWHSGSERLGPALPPRSQKGRSSLLPPGGMKTGTPAEHAGSSKCSLAPLTY